MRLVTSNLLHGLSIDHGRVDTARMVSALSELSADVLAIQEVDCAQHRSGGADQTAEIAAGMGAASWRFVPTVIGEPGAQWLGAGAGDTAAAGTPAARASYGTGLIVRGDVRSWHVVRLRAFPRRAPVFIPGANRWMLIDDEPRACIAAVIDGPWGPMTVGAVHLSFVPGWNVPQLRRVARALRMLPAPRVLLGDFNLPSPLPAAVSRWTALAADLPTFPSPSPRLQLDHALADDPESVLPSPAAAHAVRLPFSDHRALVVDL